MSTPKIVYASFDRVPSPKGAARHIDAFARALGQAFGDVDLVTVAPENSVAGADSASSVDREHRRFASLPAPHGLPFSPGVLHHPLAALGPDLIQRVLHFRTQFGAWWFGHFGARRVDVVHVRSIFEGYPIALRKRESCRRFVFEVNALPSIELKYHYPDVADDRDLIRKLQAQEQVCLEAADLIITVSNVTACYLVTRGVAPEKLRVIPNGVDADVFSFQPPTYQSDRPLHMLYSGTMTAWQGVGSAIEALALFRRDFPARLALVGPVRARQKRSILDRAWELGVSEYVRLLDPVPEAQLVALHHEADVVVAPLLSNDRNCVQGCCPLKVLEAMAAGTPLIASDLEVVRELAESDVDALLVHPGSAKAIKDAMLRLRAAPELGIRLARSARERIEREFTWRRATEALVEAYEEMLGTSRVST